ncbi:MAG TPA: tRNA (adenosine(37)-N6)-threonylcarbamoyltransferase complex dimerization subunit type 1 TsaB [Parasulfuritortus sp.]
MKILAFDTSTELCSAALCLDGAWLVREEMAGNRHSELLLPMVESLLAEAGIGLRDLDGLAYGKGPGSFTGLRIGCGAAQGLALGADLPVTGVITLEAMAYAAGADQVLACIDARMHEVYAAAYRRRDDGMIELSPPAVLKPADLDLPADGDWLGCGTGFAAYPDLLADRLRAVRPDAFPHAKAVAELALPVFAAGRGAAPDSAEPYYVRDKVALKTCER